jgi:HK97 family phage portal protein
MDLILVWMSQTPPMVATCWPLLSAATWAACRSDLRRNLAQRRNIYHATPDMVLSNLAVAARCVQLRSELLASVPLFLFRRTPNGGRERADDNSLYGVLHDISNPSQSAFEFREFMVRSLDMTGNAYARIERNARGQVVALWRYMPHDVQVEQLPNGRLRYQIFPSSFGRSEILLQEEMLHVRGPSRDGIMGCSPIQLASGALSLAMEQMRTATNLSFNGMRPSGIVSFAEKLTREQKAEFRDTASTVYGGAENSGKLMVVDGGAKFDTTQFSPEDAEFLDSRKLSNEDVARIFGLPPTTVGLVDKATYSNVEQESRALVAHAIGPLAARIETALQRCLLTDQGRARGLYIEHDLDGLLRGDVVARFTAYRIAREIGVYSANDIRRFENEPPIGPEGDTYQMPANWVPLARRLHQRSRENNYGSRQLHIQAKGRAGGRESCPGCRLRCLARRTREERKNRHHHERQGRRART